MNSVRVLSISFRLELVATLLVKFGMSVIEVDAVDHARDALFQDRAIGFQVGCLHVRIVSLSFRIGD